MSKLPEIRVPSPDAQDGWPQRPKNQWGKPPVIYYTGLLGDEFRRRVHPHITPSSPVPPLLWDHRQVRIAVGVNEISGLERFRRCSELPPTITSGLPGFDLYEAARFIEEHPDMFPHEGPSLRTVRRHGASVHVLPDPLGYHSLPERRRDWAAYRLSTLPHSGHKRVNGAPVTSRPAMRMNDGRMPQPTISTKTPDPDISSGLPPKLGKHVRKDGLDWEKAREKNLLME